MFSLVTLVILPCHPWRCPDGTWREKNLTFHTLYMSVSTITVVWKVNKKAQTWHSSPCSTEIYRETENLCTSDAKLPHHPNIWHWQRHCKLWTQHQWCCFLTQAFCFSSPRWDEVQLVIKKFSSGKYLKPGGQVSSLDELYWLAGSSDVMLYLKMDLTLHFYRFVTTLRFQPLSALMPQQKKVTKLKLETWIPVSMDVEWE